MINIVSGLACPKCFNSLRNEGEKLFCTNKDCSSVYPVLKGIPILIDDNKSVFKSKDFIAESETTFYSDRFNKKQFAKKYLPSISNNICAKKNFEKFVKMVKNLSDKPKVLIIGGSIPGVGMQPLINSGIELVETDVAFGPRTKIIADGHQLPFEAEHFDGIVVQAVLEHVLDPYKMVDEIYRVLKHAGIVYAETPFMQQVHMAPYDFTRFTHLGHIRLFRKFEELHSGSTVGPGSALAWSLMYFFLSFSRNKYLRLFFMLLTHLFFFWLKYFDYLLINKNGSLDAASGYFFFFKKTDKVLNDADLVSSYRGWNK